MDRRTVGIAVGLAVPFALTVVFGVVVLLRFDASIDYVTASEKTLRVRAVTSKIEADYGRLLGIFDTMSRDRHLASYLVSLGTARPRVDAIEKFNEDIFESMTVHGLVLAAHPAASDAINAPLPPVTFGGDRIASFGEIPFAVFFDERRTAITGVLGGGLVADQTILTDPAIARAVETLRKNGNVTTLPVTVSLPVARAAETRPTPALLRDVIIVGRALNSPGGVRSYLIAGFDARASAEFIRAQSHPYDDFFVIDSATRQSFGDERTGVEACGAGADCFSADIERPKLTVVERVDEKVYGDLHHEIVGIVTAFIAVEFLVCLYLFTAFRRRRADGGSDRSGINPADVEALGRIARTLKDARR